MKRTLFITMLAAALLGAQGRADFIPTTITGWTYEEGIRGGWIDHAYYGIYSDSSNVTDGNVQIKADPSGTDHIHHELIGGYAERGDAFSNAVTMNGGEVGALCGGGTGIVKYGTPYGGNSYSNSVTVNGGLIQETITGGSARENGDGSGGSANNNSVTLANVQPSYNPYGVVPIEVIGGDGEYDAYRNSVTVTGSGAMRIWGGYAYDKDASDNTVSVTESQVTSVIGGKSEEGDANGNTVTIDDTTVSDESKVVGIYGGYAEQGDANNNTVTVTGGQAEAVLGGIGNNANGNIVTVTDATIEYEVYGGFSVNSEGVYSGTANDNTVTMNGGQVEEICAAKGYSTIGNTVVMNGGLAGSILASNSYGGENSGNTVIVTEGVALGGIGGGYLYNDGELRDNRVYLVGKGATATIGGKQYTGGAGGIQAGAIVAAMADEDAYHYVSSGNSIDVYGTGITAGMVGYMETLTFHLGDGLASAGTPMLTITDDGLDLVITKLGFRGDDVTDWSKFEGRSITLVQAADNVTGVDDGTDVNITGEGGKTLATATLSLGSGNALVLNFSGVAPTGQTSYTANPGSPQTSAPNTIYGAYAETGDVTGGSASVYAVATGGFESLGEVFGGFTKSGNVSGCTANMDSGTAEWVYGGYTNSGDATGNTVTMSGGEVDDEVFGGYTYSGNATGNAVDMIGGYVDYYVYGGYTDSGDATGNTVTMNGGAVELGVYGGYAKSGNVTGCTANMDSGSAKWVYGGYTHSGNATDNTVNMTGGVVDALVFGGSTLSGKATGNTVTMSGGEVGLAVQGGSSRYGRATGNTVVMTGGSTGDVYGGDAWVGNATDNTVIMTGGEVGANVYGGYSYGGYSLDGEAIGNTVRLVGKGASYTIGKTTYQGGEIAIHGGVYAGSLQEGGISENNIVHIHGTGIGIGGTIDDSQQLTFHLVQGQAGAPGTPMVTLGGTDGIGLDLEGVELGFYGDAVTNWAAFEGKSITLVQAADNVTGVVDGTEVDIINEVGGTLATATLSLGSGNALVLTFSGELPGGQTSYTANPGSPQTAAPDTIYGAYAETGDVTGGSAAVYAVATGGYESLGEVFGGFTKSGNVSGCTANMDSGSAGLVFGGFTNSGNVSGCTANMDSGSAAEIIGGVTDDGAATGNTVTMNGGEVEFDVYGGWTNSGNATDNTVTMNSGTVDDWVIGGWTNSGNATDNTVTMNGGAVDDWVIGGYTESGGNATDNTAIMTGGYAVTVVGGYVYVTGNAARNTVTMTGGSAEYVIGGITADGAATGNTVRLVGAGASYTVGDTTYQGGEIAIQGSVSAGLVEEGGISENNTVHIHGTGISIGGTIDSSQQLTFHLVQGQAGAPGTPMVTLGGALDLEGVELGFYGDAVTNWAAFEGKSITLVQAAGNVTGVEAGTDVNITDEGGETLATATLTLKNGNALVLKFPGVAPEPAEGPDALDVALVNSLWASSAYVREFVQLSEAQGYSLKEGDTAVWGGGFGTFMHATGGRGFKSNGGGYGLGVRHAFSAATQAGISFGQGFGSYHNSGADGATVHQRAILAAATLSTRITGDLSLGGHLAFGSVRNRADCRLDGATERARWNDDVFNLGARLAYDFHATDDTAITPFLGLDWMTGAQEAIDGAYARHYTHGRLHELRMPAGVTVSTSVEAGSAKLLPQLSVAYVPAIAQKLPHADVTGNGRGYRVKGYAPGRNAFMLNAGMNVLFSDSWSAGAFYTLETRRHSVDQSVNASVRYTF